LAERFALRFLGVGNAKAAELGSASAVLEIDDRPVLMIDCGPRSLDDYAVHYSDSLPTAVFVTHLHLDHIGGIEQLFYRGYFAAGARTRLFVPGPIIPALHDKLAASPHVLSEGGANFWDAFHLVPCTSHFWLQDLLFDVFPVRHSGYQAAFGLALRGAFFYSGDTRPIPELAAHFASAGEPLFHDCALGGSPAHTGLDDVLREYDEGQRRRLVAYHYESPGAADALEQAGLQVARPGQMFPLRIPNPAPREPGTSGLTRVA
jgi:ribonuclease BN (tRNA processing enzyme)